MKVKLFFANLFRRIASAFSSFAVFLKKHIKKPTAHDVRSMLFKALILVAVGVALFIIGGFSVSAAMKGSVSKKIEKAPEATYDCIIVFGAKVKDNGKPSDMLADRLEAGIRLFHDKKASRILMTGDGEHDDYNEVKAMKAYAVNAGVPEECILTDPYGLSTYDSIWRAVNIFNIKSAILVTQEYHLYRALYIAQKSGLATVCGVSASLRQYSNQLFRDLREIPARFKDLFYTMTSHKPKYTEMYVE